mmetsp:Transcript_1496/g.1939  ORF Transcript_1496/g.1939 Transcript_1496/m.1939 type:complete len:474 (+) Transcript_1496:120-1541(+)
MAEAPKLIGELILNHIIAGNFNELDQKKLVDLFQLAKRMGFNPGQKVVNYGKLSYQYMDFIFFKENVIKATKGGLFIATLGIGGLFAAGITTTAIATNAIAISDSFGCILEGYDAIDLVLEAHISENAKLIMINKLCELSPSSMGPCTPRERLNFKYTSLGFLNELNHTVDINELSEYTHGVVEHKYSTQLGQRVLKKLRKEVLIRNPKLEIKILKIRTSWCIQIYDKITKRSFSFCQDPDYDTKNDFLNFSNVRIYGACYNHGKVITCSNVKIDNLNNGNNNNNNNNSTNNSSTNNENNTNDNQCIAGYTQWTLQEIEDWISIYMFQTKGNELGDVDDPIHIISTFCEESIDGIYHKPKSWLLIESKLELRQKHKQENDRFINQQYKYEKQPHEDVIHYNSRAAEDLTSNTLVSHTPTSISTHTDDTPHLHVHSSTQAHVSPPVAFAIPVPIPSLSGLSATAPPESEISQDM